MKKAAIVVGGTGGIGSGIVAALAKKGIRVAAVSRAQMTSLDLTAKHLVSHFQADATDEASVKLLFERINGELGKADYLVYAAGLPPDVRVSLAEYPLTDWDRTFDTYVKGFLIFFRSALPHMKSPAHFVVLGSAITRFPADALPPIHAGHYAAAKAALAELVKWMRREAHDHGALLSLVSPSAVDTAIHRGNGVLGAIPKKLIPQTAVSDAVVAFLGGGIEATLELVA